MKPILLILFSVFLFNSFGQSIDNEITKIIANGNESQLLKESSKYIQNEYYFHANKLVDKLLEKNNASSNYNYRKGFLLTKINNQFSEAIPYFEKAKEHVSLNFDVFSANEKNAPIELYYYLATCYHKKFELEKAKEFYSKFISLAKEKSELKELSKLKLMQCEYASTQNEMNASIKIKNMGNTINSEFPEYTPVISLDGTSLYFTARKKWKKNEQTTDPSINLPFEDIYVSYMNIDSIWSKPEKLSFCLPNRNEASVSISSDERQLYLYQDTTGNGDIYSTEINSKKKNKIDIVAIKGLNTEFWETHCYFSQDKNLLFFSSDRPGGFGGRDLYFMRKNSPNEWTIPENMGPNINSKYDEDAPFLSADNKTLYYASNGPKSMGGFDILTSENENGNWSVSKNMGTPVNSSNDEIYYTSTYDGSRGFFTSDRPNGFGEKDIYEIINTSIPSKKTILFEGHIKTADNSSLPNDLFLELDFKCEGCDEVEKNQKIYPRLRDGLIFFGLKPDKTYEMTYTKDDGSSDLFGESITTSSLNDNEKIVRNFIYDPKTKTIRLIKDSIKEIKEVVISTFKNLEFLHYFEYNKNKITTRRGDLKKFLKEIIEQLEKGRNTITVNIYSSASTVPTKAYQSNEELTKMRAENLKYDLITYFEENPAYKGRVNIVITSAIVDGPPYDADADKLEKYTPYQFVGLKTE
jgi:tetratricopeptide (TPR) repeat protein